MVAVAVVGGGIAGLSLALFLHERDVEVEIFEESGEREVGGLGINLQPYAVRSLARIGIADAVRAAGRPCREWAFFNAQGQEIFREQLPLLDGSWHRVSIARQSFRDLLFTTVRDRVGTDRYHAGWRLTGLEQAGEGCTLELAGAAGRTRHATASLVVGADGIRSTLRRILSPGQGEPRYSGKVIWRGSALRRPYLTGSTMVIVGSSAKKFVAYPIGPDGADGRQLLNWVCELQAPRGWETERWDDRAPKDQVVAAYRQFRFDWLDVPALVEASEPVYQFAMMDHDPLPRWTSGRATLMGDAAHAMYPVGSNGASQAIEDARVLARCIAETSAAPEGLRRYDEERRPTANRVVLENRGMGPDRILDLAAERAPDGFRRRADVLPDDELERLVGTYRGLTAS